MRYSVIESERLPEWKETLLMIYKDCRAFPGWRIIYDAHGEEDKRYFDMLDEIRTQKMIPIKEL